MSMNENCLCVLVVTKTAKVSVSVSGVGLGLDPAGLGLGFGLGLPGLGLGLGLSGLGSRLPGLDNISVCCAVQYRHFLRSSVQQVHNKTSGSSGVWSMDMNDSIV